MSPTVIDAINGYINDGLEEDLICEAIKDAAKASRFTWHYVNAILSDKLKRNIKTLSAYIADKQAFEKRKSSENNIRRPNTTAADERCIDDIYNAYNPAVDEKKRYSAMYGGDLL